MSPLFWPVLAVLLLNALLSAYVYWRVSRTVSHHPPGEFETVSSQVEKTAGSYIPPTNPLPFPEPAPDACDTFADWWSSKGEELAAFAAVEHTSPVHAIREVAEAAFAEASRKERA